MVTVCNWQHASHNALTVKHDGSIGHSPMHLHRYWWFLIARSWGLFALVAHTMQDEYETHSCFSREASIETRECQSHELWILVNTTTNSYPRKNQMSTGKTTGTSDNWSIQPFKITALFFQRPPFDGRVPGTLGSHDPGYLRSYCRFLDIFWYHILKYHLSNSTNQH